MKIPMVHVWTRLLGPGSLSVGVARVKIPARIPAGHQGGQRDEGAELVHGGGGGQGTQQGQEALADVGYEVDYDDDLNDIVSSSTLEMLINSA